MKNVFLQRVVYVSGFVLLSVGLAFLISMTAQKTMARGVHQPERYAKKSVRAMDKKMSLQPDQIQKLTALLRDHRQAMNTLDQNELVYWESLFRDLSSASPDALSLQMEKINALQTERNRGRLKTLLQITDSLTTAQKKAYAELMTEIAQKMIQKQADAVR